MCGIAGQFSYAEHAADVNLTALLKVRDAMHLRGPDGAGHWIDPQRRLALAHRRLSIIDLSADSDQPFWHHHARSLIVFNGEIYNYRALRAELLALGARFKSNGDTEVVAELLHRYGVRGLEKLRGMYALAYFDLDARRLTLARDPYGMKPLYYAQQAGAVIFASSVKALAQHSEISKAIDPAAEVGFLLTGSVPEPLSFLQAVQALPPGSALLIDQHGAQLQQLQPLERHFHSESVKSLTDSFADESVGRGAFVARVRTHFLASVSAHLEADVPVGCFLSSGVDSGAILGMMRDAGAAQVDTLTVRFEEFKNQAHDEGPLAAELAAYYGARHHDVWVSERDFAHDFPAFLAAMDQPSIDGMNTWMVAKATRAAGLKVAMSGLGGDELLGGYANFTSIPRWYSRSAWLRALPGRTALARPLARASERWLRRFGIHPKFAGIWEFCSSLDSLYALRRGLFLPHELDGLLDKDRLQAGLQRLLEQSQIQFDAEREAGAERIRDAFGRIAWLESTRYMRNQLLRDTDWASMAHSLEVRVPLVDSDLAAALLPMRAAVQKIGGKALLAAAPRRALPDAVLNRPKTGFSTPVAQWQQRLPALEHWRKFSSLRAEHTPWARRYAVSVLELQRTAY